MIVLDTNVLSALMRTSPEAVVVAWLDRQPADSVWLTSITVFEARFGLALLPKGRRRSSLERDSIGFSRKTSRIACSPSTRWPRRQLLNWLLIAGDPVVQSISAIP